SFSGSGTEGLVSFAGGTFVLANGASLSGKVELASGAALDVAEGVNVPYTGATLTQSGGTLAGKGTLTVSGAYTWSGGEQSGEGKAVIAKGATLSIDTSGAEVFLLSGRTLQVESGASATWKGADAIRVQEKATIENAGTFTANGGTIVGFSGAGLVHNTGTFTRSAAGTVAVGVAFANDGAVEASAGTLELTGGGAGSSTGSFSGSGTEGLASFAGGTFV